MLLRIHLEREPPALARGRGPIDPYTPSRGHPAGYGTRVLTLRILGLTYGAYLINLARKIGYYRFEAGRLRGWLLEAAGELTGCRAISTFPVNH
jgi:hypothetical protein